MNVAAPALHICRTLRERGFQAWLVGGCVRDSLMGREPHDWDVTTDALPEQTAAAFEHTVLTGAKHGTVSVILDGAAYEVTTFRSDGAYTNGRHPDEARFVATIEEDLGRRDFTCNAIAYDPIDGRWCDPYEGRRAIQDECLQCVGEPAARFAEDGLRLLRAVRFAATLGFGLSLGTSRAIAESRGNLRGIALERVSDELHKMMAAAHPSIAITRMWTTGLLEIIVPEVLPMIGCGQNHYHAFDVWEHTLRVMDAVPAADRALRLAGLFHDIGKPATRAPHPITGDATFYNHEEVGAEMTDGILQRLKFSTDERERIVHHVRHHLIPYEQDWSAAAIRRWVRRVGAGNVRSLCDLGRADVAGKGTNAMGDRDAVLNELEERIRTMTINAPIATETTQLAIGGRDVMVTLGIGPGPRVGQELKRLLDLVTEDPERNTREALLVALAEIA